MSRNLEAVVQPGQDIRGRFLYAGRVICRREWGVTMHPTGDNIVSRWEALPEAADIPVGFRHLIVSGSPQRGDLAVLYAGFIADDTEIVVDARKPDALVLADDFSLDVLRAFRRYLDHPHEDICMAGLPEPVEQTPLVARRAAATGAVLIA